MQKTLTVVDLTAIRANAERIKRLASGSAVFAVVKADAYGHGAERVSLALEPYVSGFAVSSGRLYPAKGGRGGPSGGNCFAEWTLFA